MNKAKTLGDIKQVLRPDPLARDEIPGFFVETWKARDPMASRRAELADRLAIGENVKVLLAGHAGTGKSTELVKFEDENASRFAVVKFSILREAMLPEVRIEPLLVLTVEAILRRTRELEGAFDEENLEKVYAWFSEAFREEYKERDAVMRVGAGADTSETFWGKLLGLSAFLKADIKSGCRVLNKTITKENRRLSELAFYCDTLVKDAQIALKRKGRELLLVIEDLDKCGFSDADELFIQNPAPLANLSCKAIYTFPIWLLYSPRAATLASTFPVVTLPMIKVLEKDGKNIAEEGKRAIRSILAWRLEVAELLDEKALDQAIRLTGGVLRHLFEVLVHAAFVASQAVEHGDRPRDAARIIPQDIRYGLNRLKSALLARLGTVGLPQEYHDVTTEAIFARLRELAGKAERIAPDKINLLLMQAHALIEYNNEGWCRLHPLVEEHVRSLGQP